MERMHKDEQRASGSGGTREPLAASTTGATDTATKSGSKAQQMGRVKLWPIITLVLVAALIVVFRMRVNGSLGETPSLVLLLVLILAIIGSVTMFGLTILRNLFIPEEKGEDSRVDLRKRALRDEVEQLKAQRED